MEVKDDTPVITDFHSSNGNITKIETIDVTNYPITKKKGRISDAYDKNLCKDNQTLTDFINKCIFLDPTSGMETVINKVLLPAFVRANKEYRDSEKFRKVITKAFRRLIKDPHRKYTHISDVVETLKLHVSSAPKSIPPPVKPDKKRVNLITLSTKVSVKTQEQSRKRPTIASSSSKISPKKSKPEVIALDCDDDDEVIPIDDESKDSVISKRFGEISKINTNNDIAIENLVKDDTIEIQDSQEIKIIDDVLTVDKDNEQIINKSNNHGTAIVNGYKENEKENLGSNENLSDENKLLIPHKHKIVRLEKPAFQKKEPAKKPEEMTELEKARRIKIIEAKIEKCDKAIAKLDLEEVTDDSANSPYYKSDRLRATIVKLYKELCTLVGEEPAERRKIRLQIKEGVPQGPIRRLEKFLNKQADDAGETPFPDFIDVVRCVEKSNEADGLGWSKAKIMKEAQAIFTYCGRALQKRRQQREWKHLRAIVKPEEFEADPAERDKQLQARLEANRRIAKQREAEVFSKFTSVESAPEPTASTSFQIEEPSEHEDSSSDEETKAVESIKNPEENTEPIEPIQNNKENTEPIQNNKEKTVTIEPIQNPEEKTVTIEPIQNPEERITPIHSTEATVCKDNYNNVSKNDGKIEETDVVIKQELEDVPINIQYQGDISLVIEISDSESEDEYGVLTF